MRSVIYGVFSLMVILFGALQSNAQCMNGSAPSVLNISIDSATVTWPAATGAAGYEYVVQVATLPQPATGTSITGTTVRVGGLTPNASHKAWLRNDCGSGNYSPWNSATFTTSCGSTGNIHMSNITNTSVTVNWAVVGGASGYEYVVDQSSGNPAGSGTALGPVTTVNITGLSDSSFYYAHVRTICGGTIYSSWVTQMFFTAYPTGLNTLAGNETPAIKAYPNPMNAFINLEFQNSKGQVTVFNTLGRIIYRSPVTANNMRIETADYPNGVYFIRYSDDARTETVRVLKQ